MLDEISFLDLSCQKIMFDYNNAGRWRGWSLSGLSAVVLAHLHGVYFGLRVVS